MTRQGAPSAEGHEVATRRTTRYLAATSVAGTQTGSSVVSGGTGDAPTESMSTQVEELVKSHRVECAKREAAWQDELERRRREIAERSCIDIAALRAKLAI